MNKLKVNKELSSAEVYTTLFDALTALGVDTESLTISELHTIKRGLINGIAEVNVERLEQ